ncbi:neo-calmodulin-like [Dermacentor andersoni]|uniref:neo-calmodulin-like n=1 Tax=Dermacentor andersoni TaxID=34620 RepID=UPI0021557953|nr:calmodulin-A-like isoform X1 [Dermacentor andersoni]
MIPPRAKQQTRQRLLQLPTLKMAHSKQLSPEEIADIKGAFLLFDRNGDGVISCAELEMVLRALGERPSADEMARIVRQVDRNFNGSIDFQEFLAFMVRKMSVRVSTRADVLKAFQVFDRDSNGYITKAELTQIFTKIGQSMTLEEAEKIIAEVDADKDGRINYAEFLNKIMPEEKEESSSSNKQQGR